MKKIKFEIKTINDQKAIYIDNELFDWQIDEEELSDAINFANNDQEVKKAIQADIKDFFLQCVKEIINYDINLKQLNEALNSGYLEIHDNN